MSSAYILEHFLLKVHSLLQDSVLVNTVLMWWDMLFTGVISLYVIVVPSLQHSRQY
jgi:hypothetical protein